MSRYSPTGRPERWDRDRFDSHARGEPQLIERERYEERDYYAPQRQRERSVDRYPRSPPPRFQEYERDVYEEKDRYAAPMPFRSRQTPGRFYDDEGDNLEGAMTVRPRERERDLEIDIRRTTERYGPPARREPKRPTFVRRQSSLDTFDRKPMPRYGDRVREETIIIPSGPSRRSPPRYRSPPRFERDYEEDIRIAEPEFYGDDEFRGYREREVERVRKTRRRSGGTVVEEEEREEIVEKEFPRRGKTRMPMRLVNRRAVVELGYPFEEEGETLIILKALGKEHIDEVIKLSKEMKAAPKEKETRTTTYVYESNDSATGPPEIIPPPPGFEEKIIERRTEIIRDGGSPSSEVPRSVRDWDVMSKSTKRRSPSPAASSHTHHRRRSTHSSRPRSVSSVSTKREIILAEERDESASIRGPIGALIVPDRERRNSRSIKAEIKALEAEKKALRYEREAEKLRGETSGGEIIIARERDDVVEIRKDKKGKMSLVR